MEVKVPIDKNLGASDDKKTSNESFVLFVKSVVKSEVKNIFKSLSEEGVQAGKKEIDKSKRK